MIAFYEGVELVFVGVMGAFCAILVTDIIQRYLIGFLAERGRDRREDDDK